MFGFFKELFSSKEYALERKQALRRRANIGRELDEIVKYMKAKHLSFTDLPTCKQDLVREAQDIMKHIEKKYDLPEFKMMFLGKEVSFQDEAKKKKMAKKAKVKKGNWSRSCFTSISSEIVYRKDVASIYVEVLVAKLSSFISRIYRKSKQVVMDLFVSSDEEDLACA
jgi:hypothetical protein